MPVPTSVTAQPPAPPPTPGRQEVAPVITWTPPVGDTITLTDRRNGWKTLAGARGLGMASYQLYTQASPAVDGDRITGVRARPREVMLPLYFHADTRPAFVGKLERLVRSMRPKLGDGTLTVAAPSGGRRWVKARYVEGLAGEESTDSAGVTWWKAGVVLHVSQPYWTAARPYTNEWGTGGSGTSFYPMGPGWQVVNSQVIGTGMEIPNEGDVEAYPLWTVEGPAATGSVFRNNTLGLEWGLNRDLLAGEVATINCEQRIQTAELADGTDLWPNLTDGADLWPLAPGVNDVDMVLSGTTGDTRVAIRADIRHEIAYADAEAEAMAEAG